MAQVVYHVLAALFKMADALCTFEVSRAVARHTFLKHSEASSMHAIFSGLQYSKDILVD